MDGIKFDGSSTGFTLSVLFSSFESLSTSRAVEGRCGCFLLASKFRTEDF